eukprot:3391204-Prymnesium_polylepis.1
MPAAHAFSYSVRDPVHAHESARGMREPSWRVASPQQRVRSATGMLPAARRGTAACPPSIRRFRAASRHRHF